MIVVVVDTNVFARETHLLRKKGGPALVQLLRAINGRLLIPEILRRECVEQTVKMANEGRHGVDAAFDTLDTLLGVRLKNPFPENEAIRLGAAARLRELEELTIDDPLTPELYSAAGIRSLESRPPTSKKDHGYKDCLIWESVLRQPHGSEVWFISRDSKAFFEGDAFHPELLSEARDRGINVMGYRDIERAVKKLREANPSMDFAVLETEDRTARADVPVEDFAFPTPAPRPAKIPDHDPPPSVDTGEITRRLSESQERFNALDLKVLAYIAYFGSASKNDLFIALADAGLASDVARNIAERLVMSGFVNDTGNHYLVMDRAVGDLVAPTVEPEIIAWLRNKGKRNGN